MLNVSRFPAVAVLLLLLLSLSADAQTPLSNLLYTVGTTINSGGQERSFVVLDAFDGVAARGRSFAVYGKPGVPTNAASFTLRGTMAVQTDPAVINNLLNQSVALGQNLSTLNDGITLLLHKIPGITNQSLPQKISTGLQAAATDPELSESMHLLGLGNPGMQLCLGRAFTELIPVVTTYELRELNPASGAAGDVAGRVTLVPGAPVVLPAPGKPFQVVTNDPIDHLQVRLRWGTPPELRRLSVLNSGFDVWRIPRAMAESGNFHVTPPTTAQLLSNPNFARANRGSVATSTDYGVGSGPGNADDPNDRITFFFADNGRANGTTFTDGQEFYYFITARDLLGRDGLVSPGGLARACRRIPPKAPTDVKVENVVLPGTTNLPRLKVVWQQNTNAADLVTQYWIYRWQNPSGIFTNDAAPLTNRIGVVAHAAGTNLNSFIDNGAGALTAPGLSNIWYTVRAVSVAACDPLLSPHAGPAWGVLRQRDGPIATTGNLVGSCGIPVVAFQQFVTNTVNPDAQLVRMRFTCVRRDSGIAWVQFNITNSVNFDERSVGPIYFPPDGDTVQWDFDVPALITSQARQVYVGCVVGTTYGHVSKEVTVTINTPYPNTQQREVVFYSGQLLTTALSSSDPLLTVLNGGQQSYCIGPYSVVPDVSGMVALKFDFNGPYTAMIQAQTNGVWSDIAVITPDSNRVYWVWYPACLVGPVPPFRACVVNVPDAGDCDEHIAAAADNLPIAPIRVRFRLTPRTAEYRVYRRVDEGPMTLFAQGAALYDPANPSKLIESKDEAMPPSSARLCYFVQLLDQHGNGSPLSFIGCKSVKPAKPARPVLAEPQPVGTVGSPQVLLNWFCPTSGISRFQFKIRRTDKPAASAPSGFSSGALSPYAGYKVDSAFAGLDSHTLQYYLFSEAHLTKPIGPAFGPGPQFTLSANVLANVPYDICVTPVDEQGTVLEGSTSEVWHFTWTPPVLLATVPWPKRPLPGTADFDTPPTSLQDFYPRVAATLFLDGNFAYQDRYRPVGIRIGLFDNSLNFQFSNVGSTNFIIYNAANTIINPDPHLQLFRSNSRDASRANQLILPIVIYRQQLTNTLFPKVSGDVVQVSPLIERIPWIYNAGTKTVTIPDRLLAMRGETYNDHSYYMLYVRDQQPVLAGARYVYHVVRFNAQREVQEIISAGEVELPLNGN